MRELETRRTSELANLGGRYAARLEHFSLSRGLKSEIGAVAAGRRKEYSRYGHPASIKNLVNFAHFSICLVRVARLFSRLHCGATPFTHYLRTLYTPLD
jgi:hypothetical protein